MKILITKSPRSTMLLIGKEAEEEMAVLAKPSYMEYHEFDVTGVYGVLELVAFALKQEFALGLGHEE